jgi:hypothetical protein
MDKGSAISLPELSSNEAIKYDIIFIKFICPIRFRQGVRTTYCLRPEQELTVRNLSRGSC